jgi:hypothetical protein
MQGVVWHDAHMLDSRKSRRWVPGHKDLHDSEMTLPEGILGNWKVANWKVTRPRLREN